MRAATVIVGATAVSSCLIALAFLLSGNSQSSPQGGGQASEQEARSTAQTAATPATRVTNCSKEFTVRGVSCEVGASLLSEYQPGSEEAVVVMDAEKEESLTFSCVGTAPTICTDEDGASVYLAP